MNDQRRIQEFRDAMEAGGLTPPAKILTDGLFHHCPTLDRPDKKNGSYVLHLDGVAVGSFQDWAGSTGWQTWHAGAGSTLTPAETEAIKKKLEAQKKQCETEERMRQADAQERARQIWEAAPPCTDHPYLTKKGIQAHDVRLAPDGSLIILANDMDGIMHTLQFIDGDGNKRFLTGGRVRGCFHMIGESTSSLYICEGFATGASIHEATGCGVNCLCNHRPTRLARWG
jgi:putative DNA primase/helicase